MSAQPQPRLINARDCLARFARGRKFALNYKINQQQCDFLMLYCCLPTHTHARTHTHTATNKHRSTRTLMQMGKGKNSLLEYGGEKVGVAYFLNKLMLCLTVETCNKNDAK